MLKYVIPPRKKGIDALGIKEIRPRRLQPGEVCVRMHAVSLNYRDLLVVKRGVSRELVPLSDGAGVVAEVGRIHPVVDRVFGFDQVQEAYAYLQSARHFGKVVIRLDG